LNNISIQDEGRKLHIDPTDAHYSHSGQFKINIHTINMSFSHCDIFIT